LGDQNILDFQSAENCVCNAFLEQPIHCQYSDQLHQKSFLCCCYPPCELLWCPKVASLIGTTILDIILDGLEHCVLHHAEEDNPLEHNNPLEHCFQGQLANQCQHMAGSNFQSSSSQWGCLQARNCCCAIYKWGLDEPWLADQQSLYSYQQRMNACLPVLLPTFLFGSNVQVHERGKRRFVGLKVSLFMQPC
jgi:hypothetical protein